MANSGINHNIKNGFLELLKFRGKIAENQKEYYLSTNSLSMFDRKDSEKSFFLNGKAVISEQMSNLTAGIIKIFFYDKFKTPKQVNAKHQVSCLLDQSYPGHQENMHIVSIKQFLEYNEAGQLKVLKAQGKVNILLKNNKNMSRIFCSSTIIRFNEETGRIKRIILNGKSIVNNRGKKDFNLTADNIQIQYDNKGAIISCTGRNNCHFKIDNFRSRSDLLEYFIPKDSFWIRTASGNNDGSVTLETDSNLFSSKLFKVNTKKKLLSSNTDIKSLIKFNKANLFFKATPVTILSKSIYLNNEANDIIYRGDVKIFQNETEFFADVIKISNGSNIDSEGNINIQFPGTDGLIKLKAQKLNYNQDLLQLSLLNKAVLKQGLNTLKAQTIMISISPQNKIEKIQAEDPENIIFKKDKIFGKSGKLIWLYEQSIIKFFNSASISKNNYRTRAEEIQLNLKNDNIEVLSKNKDRTETILIE
jgi:lipopolysaccharide transport protein LptA